MSPVTEVETGTRVAFPLLYHDICIIMVELGGTAADTVAEVPDTHDGAETVATRVDDPEFVAWTRVLHRYILVVSSPVIPVSLSNPNAVSCPNVAKLL